MDRQALEDVQERLQEELRTRQAVRIMRELLTSLREQPGDRAATGETDQRPSASAIVARTRAAIAA